MNNVKTRFVIAITQRLAAAPDSDAKIDLIDELSENLYGRYQDMVSGGMAAEDAYQKALGELGDVDELLAYLGAVGQTSARPDSTAPNADGTSTADDWFQNLKDISNQAINKAKDAMLAATAACDAAKQLHDRNADSFHINTRVQPDQDELEVPSLNLREISVNIIGDLSINLDDDPDAPIQFEGDIDDLEIILSEDGTLTITQGKSASGSFLFSRALSSASIALSIPQRPWEKLDITTVSGDIDIQDGELEADILRLHTASGDMQLDCLRHTRRLEVQSASGDLSLTNCVCDELVFRSASGDLQGGDITAAVMAETSSGDLDLTGHIRALHAVTASGDISVETGLLPETVEISSKSGECSLRIPDNNGFILQYGTVSGSVYSDFPLTTSQAQGRRSGEARYQDGGDGRVFMITSVSGDIELRRG